MQEKEENYNPLEKKHIGESVVRALLNKPATPLSLLEPFVGVGIYAIYYKGDFPAYSVLSAMNEGGKFALPIYVGKAVPAGARKGLGVQIDHELYKRLREHAETISMAQSLRSEDFFYRSLNIDDIWIPLGETLLIEMYRPVWNVVVDGYGNHDPGSGRYNQMRSRWDVLHPGRAWAEKCRSRPESPESIVAIVGEYLAGLEEAEEHM